jgi:hypothetical protein
VFLKVVLLALSGNYGKEGAPAFFKQRVRHRKGNVITPEVLEKAQQLLDQGWNRCYVAKELGIKSDTFRKAIYGGRLHEMEDKPARQNLTTKSTRDKIDADSIRLRLIASAS